MNPAFKKRQVLFTAQLFIGALVVYMMHQYLLSALQPDRIWVISPFSIYVFHFISVLLVYTIINFRFSTGKTQVFNPFILLMIVKMLVVVLFLLPLFVSDTRDKVGDAVNFFIPYFIFLGFEVFSINRFLTAD